MGCKNDQAIIAGIYETKKHRNPKMKKRNVWNEILQALKERLQEHDYRYS